MKRGLLRRNLGVSLELWASGEIGRRAGLRGLWSQILGGSSPLSPTKHYQH